MRAALAADTRIDSRYRSVWMNRPIAERFAAVRAAAEAGIPVVLRTAPLMPRSPLSDGCSLGDFGLAEAQTLDDLRTLCLLAREVGAP